jgi:hypothetical protein
MDAQQLGRFDRRHAEGLADCRGRGDAPLV